MNPPVESHNNPHSMSGVPLGVVDDEARGGPAALEPSLSDLTEALASRVDFEGAVTPGIVGALRGEMGWEGRLLDILEVLTKDVETMGYLAGGRHPDEVVTWLSVWVGSDLSIDEIRLVVSSGGWDPDPFVVLAREGLLTPLLTRTDGSCRHIRGERAGGWVSDEMAMASDAEVIAVARAVLAEDEASSSD